MAPLLFLLACQSEDATTKCGDGALVVDGCTELSTDSPRDPHELGDGFPTVEDTGVDLPESWLEDGGFEDHLLVEPWDPAATPPGWTATGSPSWLRVGGGLETGEAHGGRALVELEAGDELRQRIPRLLTFIDNRYLVRAWARADAPSDAEIALSFYDVDDNLLSETTLPVTAWPTWGAHLVGGTGPSGIDSVEVAIRGAAQFDDVRLEVIDGNTLDFDLASVSHTFQGFGVHVSPYAADAEPVAEMMAELGIHYVRIEDVIETPTGKDLLATAAATGKAPWLLTAWSVPTEFSDGTGVLSDVDGFADYWTNRAVGLDSIGIVPEGIELLHDPTPVDPATYADLVEATRVRLDKAGLVDVALVGPGAELTLDGHDARDRMLALGSETALDAWSLHAEEDSELCTDGASCTAMAWDDVLSTLGQVGGKRPIRITRLATDETTFRGATWPSPTASQDFNATMSVGYAVRVIADALASINAGADRVYFWYAVDGTAPDDLGTGWGLVTESGAPKPLYDALAVIAPPIANGAQVLEAPFQTSQLLYGSAFLTDDRIVLLITNESDGTQPLDLVLHGTTGKETLLSATSFVRIVVGNPDIEWPDQGVGIATTVSATAGDGTLELTGNLLASTVTLIELDPTP